MARFNVISPLSITFLLAGLLMFAVIGIVRSVTTPSQVGAMTEQGYSRINAANNIAGAVELPSYPSLAELQPTNAGQQPETWNPLTDGRRSYMEGGAIFDQPGLMLLSAPGHAPTWQDAMPDNPTWLTTVRDPNGWFWVYGGAWFSCQHIDTVNLTYASIRTDPALAVWAALAMRDQSNVADICKR